MTLQLPSWLLDGQGARLLVLFALIAVGVALLRRRFVFGALRAIFPILAVAGLLLGVGLAGYVLLVDDCADVQDLADGTSVTLLGRTANVRAAPDGRAAFEVIDPSGRAMVVSPDGPPAPSAYVVVHGRKGSWTGKTFIEASWRLSTP